MNREQLEAFLSETYEGEIDHPWMQYPSYEVFRHGGGKKWFALIMDVPKSKLGMEGDERLDVVNFKCEPALIGSLLREEGFFPAYHMSKANWITAALDGTAGEDKIKMLADISYELTRPRPRRDGR